MIHFARHSVVLLGSAFLSVFLAAPLPASDEDLLYRELSSQPYDVRLHLQWSPSLRLSGELKDEVISDLQQFTHMR